MRHLYQRGRSSIPLSGNPGKDENRKQDIEASTHRILIPNPLPADWSIPRIPPAITRKIRRLRVPTRPRLTPQRKLDIIVVMLAHNDQRIGQLTRHGVRIVDIDRRARI